MYGIIVKLLNCFIATSPNPSFVNNLTIEQYNNRKPRGFTLIELLIVIAVLGIVSAGILTAINVAGNLNKANLAKAKTFAASIENDLSINQVGKWSFEGNVNDNSGYNISSTPNGTVPYATNDELGGQALQLNGNANNYIALPDNTFSSLTEGTLSAWVFLNGSGTQGLILYVKNTGNFNQLIFEIENGKIHQSVFPCNEPPSGCGGSWRERYGNPVIKNGRWYHVAVIVGSAGWKMYVNGQPDGSGIGAEFFDNVGVPTRVTIGSDRGTDYGGRAFNGQLDEVAIYNQALTAYQIQHLYAKGFLKHYMAQVYPFNY